MTGFQEIRNKMRSVSSRWFEIPAATVLTKLGMRPAVATLFGIIGSFAAAYFVSQGQFIIAGVLVFISGLFDLIDGALARKSGITSRRGALLDSTADRVSEFAVLLGMILYFTATETSNSTGSVLTFIALAGSMLISYIRARAEGLDLSGQEGFMTRPERVVIIGIGLLVGQPLVTVWVLGIGTVAGALQRFWGVWRSVSNESS